MEHTNDCAVVPLPDTVGQLCSSEILPVRDSDSSSGPCAQSDGSVIVTVPGGSATPSQLIKDKHQALHEAQQAALLSQSVAEGGQLAPGQEDWLLDLKLSSPQRLLSGDVSHAALQHIISMPPEQLLRTSTAEYSAGIDDNFLDQQFGADQAVATTDISNGIPPDGYDGVVVSDMETALQDLCSEPTAFEHTAFGHGKDPSSEHGVLDEAVAMHEPDSVFGTVEHQASQWLLALASARALKHSLYSMFCICACSSDQSILAE